MRHFTFPIALTLLLVAATPALANFVSVTVCFVPGFQAISLWYALPLSVLAAALERPFVTRAGVPRYAFCASLQANAISTLIGFLFVTVAYASLQGGYGDVWILFSVLVSIVTEGFYYLMFAVPQGGVLKWRWIVGGNLCSAFVILVVPVLASITAAWNPDLRWEVEPYEDLLPIWGAIGSSVLFVLGFLLPPFLSWCRNGAKLETPIPAESPQNECKVEVNSLSSNEDWNW